jgi:hypothetical protein
METWCLLRGKKRSKSLGSFQTVQLFCMDLGTDSNYLHIQYQMLAFYNGDTVFTAW